MNLVKALQDPQSKAVCDQVIAYVGVNAERFKDLVNVFLAGPYRVTQHAAWPLTYCVEHHPELIKPHLRKLILTWTNQDNTMQ